MEDAFILTKEVDWSLLHRGFAIPVNMQPIISSYLRNGALEHGEKREIKLIFDNEFHDAVISSVNFNKTKYYDHKDMWQILYRQNGTFAQKLRLVYNKSYNILSHLKKERTSNHLIKLPRNEKEFIVLYTTDNKDVFFIDAIFNNEFVIDNSQNELVLENAFNDAFLTDETANIMQKYRLTKIRKLNRKIGNYLKKLYGYRCQICGENIGMKYDANVIECHHINYFIESLNNDVENLLIICPNHHRIIHSTNPTFDKNNKTYHYPNGYEEPLKLNLHL